MYLQYYKLKNLLHSWSLESVMKSLQALEQKKNISNFLGYIQCEHLFNTYKFIILIQSVCDTQSFQPFKKKNITHYLFYSNNKAKHNKQYSQTINWWQSSLSCETLTVSDLLQQPGLSHIKYVAFVCVFVRACVYWSSRHRDRVKVMFVWSLSHQERWAGE